MKYHSAAIKPKMDMDTSVKATNSLSAMDGHDCPLLN